MADRTTFSGASTDVPWKNIGMPEGFGDNQARHFKKLYDASALPLTAVGGTADAVTATLDPALDGGGLVDGMKFEITWGATNTAGVTLALNGAAAVPVLDASGNTLIASSIGAGLRSLLEYIGGSFRILSPLLTSMGGGSARYYYQFTASGTWNKPAGLDDDASITVEAWAGGGGGGSGANGGGGGGGGYAKIRLRAGDVPSSVTVTIGPGGAIGSRGGNTTFGSLLTAFNGGAGDEDGGGGGGELSQGANGGASSNPPVNIAGGAIGGGNGGGGNSAGVGNPGGEAATLWGGGGGGGGSSVGAGGSGGMAVFGGGGGEGDSTGGGSGGASKFGGNGGSTGVAGAAPGGGGGRNAAGARGEVRVWI